MRPRKAVLHFVKNGITVAGMTTITCKIPEKLDDELEAIVEKRGISKSEFVREAIEHNLEHQKKKVKVSAYDLMKDTPVGPPANLYSSGSFSWLSSSAVE